MINEELHSLMRDHINQVGVFTVAMLPEGVNEDFEVIDIDTKTHFGNSDDACIYTVGLRKLGRPDILVKCGPGYGTCLYDTTRIKQNVINAGRLISHLFRTWNDASPLKNGDICEDRTHNIYVVVKHESLSKLDLDYKKRIMKYTTDYYGDINYNILVLDPIGLKQ